MQNTTHCFNDNKQYLVTSYSTTRIQRKRAMRFLSKNHNEKKTNYYNKKILQKLIKTIRLHKKSWNLKVTIVIHLLYLYMSPNSKTSTYQSKPILFHFTKPIQFFINKKSLK